jgi:hypothetical protein
MNLGLAVYQSYDLINLRSFRACSFYHRYLSFHEGVEEAEGDKNGLPYWVRIVRIEFRGR